ncbi:Crp/Fnr family transcriptional regulator [Pseudolabrys sp. Root1462]|jgi:CRP-like cAMP-binding protein|uniref:Crp/Fnr family transcriptional regulator n=1 Tax=Pseudolabrys sp. Root1462 TaxID=1736466 RepID=UPI0009E9B9F8|nr:Crp/Fnr family transcriptional regulator [Pseudolabrys sp. Root1462]
MEFDLKRIPIESEKSIVNSSGTSRHQLKIIDGMPSDVEDTLAPPKYYCATCPANELNICEANNRPRTTAFQRLENLHLNSYEQRIPARRIILHPKEYSEHMSIICSGWAFSAIILPDGRKQILSFLHSGDVVSDVTPWMNMSRKHVVAITDVTLRKFKCSEVKNSFSKRVDMFEIITKLWAEERAQADELIVSLGRRRGEGRIAQLILFLMKKLVDRGMVTGQTMMFPLRQSHIADATGLTAVHVSKVLGDFQRKDLIRIENRSLAILNAEGLQRIVAS